MRCTYVMAHTLNRAFRVADSSLLQFWLLGYEFPTTLMLLTLDTIYILTTAKKGAHICHGIASLHSTHL